MSGGVAYVLDLDLAKVNREMVELEQLTDGDVETLREMLDRPPRRDRVDRRRGRCSATGRRPRPAFTKVMPKDYKRVLEAMERAREEGVDVDEAVMASVAPPSSSTPFTKKG